MKNYKVYARQLDPYYTESPLYICDIWPDDLAVYGNSRMNDHIPDLVKNAYEEINGDYFWSYFEDIEDGRKEYYSNFTEMFSDLIPRNDGKRYSTRQIHALKEIFRSYDPDEADDFCAAYSIIDGHTWESTTIRGTSQGDWQDIIYRADAWSAAAIESFEFEYFNLGSEFMIHDEDTPPTAPEEISGYCVYTHSWDTDEIREELADAAGCDPDDIFIYSEFTSEFDEWSEEAGKDE